MHACMHAHGRTHVYIHSHFHARIHAGEAENMFEVTAQAVVDDKSSESESDSDSSVDSEEELWLDEHAGVLGMFAEHGVAVGEKRKKAEQEAAEASWARVMRSRPASVDTRPVASSSTSAGRDCARLFSAPH